MRVLLTGPSEPSTLVTTGRLPQGLMRIHGGIPVNALALGLAKRGVDVTVVTGSPYISEKWRGGDNPRVVALPFRASEKRRLLDLYRRERRDLSLEMSLHEFDVVHANWTYEYALAALDVEPKSLVTARDAPVEELTLERRPGLVWRLAMATLVRRRVQYLSANSPYTAMRWAQQMLWRGRIPVVPNMSPSLAVPFLEKANELKVLSVGHLSRTKNLGALVAAWRVVSKMQPKAQLELVGSDLRPDNPKARSLVAGTANVSLLGHLPREEVVSRMREASLVVHPSVQESLGNVFLEAMSVGTPLLANRACDAARYVLEGELERFLVEMGDPERLATEITRALVSNTIRSEWQRSALQRVYEAFSEDAVIASWMRLYRQVERGNWGDADDLSH